MKLFKKIKDVINASILCLRFPFLYPRNRFDGEYHCGLLSNWTYKLRLKARQSFIITGKVNKSDDYFSHNANFFDYHVKLDEATKQIFIRTRTTEIRFDYSKLVWGDNKFEILGIKVIFTITGLPMIQVQVKPIDENDDGNYGFAHYREEIVINRWYNFWYKVVDWIDTKVLARAIPEEP